MPQRPINSSLIISTYNWPEALELSLLSVLNQTIRPSEIIVADDGSTDETSKVIDKIKSATSIPIKHVWQPDEGFQLAKIRNKAIAASSGEYILQIDGDVILHSRFIADHLKFAADGYFVQGSRVMLGPDISKKLLASKSIKVNLFQKDIKRKENGIRWLWLSNFLLKKYRNRYPTYWARGANMAFWRKDLIEVNGYNENFTGWGDEDSELTLRLMNSGKRKLYMKFAGIIYHIYHKESSSKNKSSKNRDLLQETLTNNIVRCNLGIDRYLNSNNEH